MSSDLSSTDRIARRSAFAGTATCLLALCCTPAWAEEPPPATAPNAPADVVADAEATDDTAASAEDAAPAAAEEAPPVRRGQLPTVTVIGSADAAAHLPGSAAYIDAEALRQQSYDDVNQVLRPVPGVYLRPEDGYGLFPNISLRGVDTSRSAKLTLMEDGVLIAPAPYSAPEAYMSPTAGRMRALEVIKGSSQIMYGPHITGGVINYIATPIPDVPTGFMKFIYGTDDEIRVHAHYGSTYDIGAWGRFGFVGELYYRTTDGFKEIDSAPGFNGGDTGFTAVEPMIKLMWEPDSEQYQRLEFKYGYTDRDANETYLGLAEDDFRSDPYRRYAASRFDNIATYANRAYLRHYIELTDQIEVTTTLYYNNFHRNWYKLNDLQDIDTDGDGAGDGLNQSLSAALAGADGGVGLDVLRGERAGDLRVRANNRNYYAYGVSIDPTFNFSTDGVDHEVKFGFRYHYDRVRRFQHDDVYMQDMTGAIIGVTEGGPGSQDNRREQTKAIAFYVQDAMDFGRLTLIPGVRVEHLWQEVENFNAGTGGSADYTVAGGGIGGTYELDEHWTALGGVHRGFSTPSPGAAVGGLRDESSIAVEAGLRFRDERRALVAEVIGFYTYFDDLIVIDNIGSGGAGMDENVGRVDAYGVELLLQYDPGIACDWGFSMPNWISFTYTNAELASDSNSSDAESLFGGGRKGNKVPYIPPYVLTLGSGVEFKRFGLFLTGSFVDATYTTAFNTSDQMDADGDPDARFGKLDSRFIVDISGYYRLNEQAKVVGGVHNLFDEEYVASRHPHGPRPGQPRFLYVGMELDF